MSCLQTCKITELCYQCTKEMCLLPRAVTVQIMPGHFVGVCWHMNPHTILTTCAQEPTRPLISNSETTHPLTLQFGVVHANGIEAFSMPKLPTLWKVYGNRFY